ncbi:hypothetical protein COCVIDRAFT_89407 [Bipolaris victoriae FI3]|uniref:Uncharacterized protein n=1 Tax=Bipolaris victoriae (strain FI3) TaxID=930091 RepID=W7ERV1_BIPV3|nr:hypothetical protein COCVIDRAFT_89407 [Bipolaris victoriae FI3]
MYLCMYGRTCTGASEVYVPWPLARWVQKQKGQPRGAWCRLINHLRMAERPAVERYPQKARNRYVRNRDGIASGCVETCDACLGSNRPLATLA